MLQVIFAGCDTGAWRDGTQGLPARDIAMNIALPEVDGRIVTRAVSFKGVARRDPLTETDIVGYEPDADRVEFVAELAANWVRLRRTPPLERRIALVLARINKDGRMGNGVGLDMPASAVNVLQALAEAGYRVDDIPADGNGLIERLTEGPTNDTRALRRRLIEETYPRSEYGFFFAGLPRETQQRTAERWGRPEGDPFFLAGELDCGRFAVPAFRCGNIAVCAALARGYNINPDIELPRPRPGAAARLPRGLSRLRHEFAAHAVIHNGKHGNLEWLPGRLPPSIRRAIPPRWAELPQLYPFIVNDPGEGTQAKRRTGAVIIDHLVPPLTRAETYGPLKGPRGPARRVLRRRRHGPPPPRRPSPALSSTSPATPALTATSASSPTKTGRSAASTLFLCDLKEAQIRDGLHIFGQTPDRQAGARPPSSPWPVSRAAKGQGRRH